LHTTSKKQTRYYHQILQAVIVHPDMRQVLPMAPEAVQNTDGAKNQGYHIEHNYGHGRRNLSLNFFLLNLFAFFMHEIFQLTDQLYQACRRKVSARKEYFALLRHTFQILIFRNRQHMLEFIHAPPDLYAP
jgi:hypothetical protein